MFGGMRSCPPPVDSTDDARPIELPRADDAQRQLATPLDVGNPADETDGPTPLAN